MVIVRNTAPSYTRSFIKLDREDGSVLSSWDPADGYSVGNGNKHVCGPVMAYSLDNRFIRIFDTERMEVVRDLPLPGTATYISGLGPSVFALQAVSYTESRVWQINLDTYDARPLFTIADTDTSFFGFATLPVPYVNDQLDTCLLILTRPNARSSLNRFALINYPIASPEQADTIWLPRYFDTDNPPVFTVYHQGMVVCSDLENNQLAGINISRKHIVWTKQTNNRDGSDWPVAGDGRFYVAASSFWCLDIATGETVWKMKKAITASNGAVIPTWRIPTRSSFWEILPSMRLPAPPCGMLWMSTMLISSPSGVGLLLMPPMVACTLLASTASTRFTTRNH